MAVATAMTADRRPIFLAITWRTIVVALSYRAGVIAIQDCGPVVPTGVSRSCAGSGPRLGARHRLARDDPLDRVPGLAVPASSCQRNVMRWADC